MKKKILFICFLFLFIGLFSSCIKTFAYTDAVYRRSKVNVGVNNDTQNNYFAIFSINSYILNDNTIYSIYDYTWTEDNIQGSKSLTFDSGISSSGDYLITNTNNYLYEGELYLLTYSNSTRAIKIHHLSVSNYDTGAVFIDETDSLYNNPLVYNEQTDWTYGQLTDYADKQINIYGQTLQLFIDNSPNNNNSIQYLNTELNVYARLKIIPSLTDSAYNDGYNAGRSAGYNAGYTDGQSGENAISPIWNVLTGIFSAVGSIFAIELAPHIYLGYFILVPLFFIMVLGILAIWRKNY